LISAAESLSPHRLVAVPRRLEVSARALVGLVLVQIYLGALVAGLRAGLLYNTWPLIDGHFIPSAHDLLFNSPAWHNFFENPLTAQFDHRMVAYAVLLLVLLHAVDVTRSAANARARALVFLAALMLQAGLGIATLLLQAPLALALAHQAMAMVVLAAAVVHAQRVRAATARASVTSAAPLPSAS
jgi:cytochrome c oxidase assembly protein subunit 15